MGVKVKRRGAFDIGSGTIKLQISDVDVASGRIKRTVFGEERPCAFGADYLKSRDGTLSASIQEKGAMTIAAFQAIGEKYGVEAYAAVATAVFRKANNGEEFLDRVRSMGVPVSTITQEEEAELGHATAVAISGKSFDECVSWDSGGGSFQISYLQGSSLSAPSPSGSSASASLDSYMGGFGSSFANKTLVEEVQGRRSEEVQHLNPVSIQDAMRLVEALRSRLDREVPDWLRDAPEVTAIGGPNSVFQLTGSILEYKRRLGKIRGMSVTSDDCISSRSSSSSGSRGASASNSNSNSNSNKVCGQDSFRIDTSDADADIDGLTSVETTSSHSISTLEASLEGSPARRKSESIALDTTEAAEAEVEAGESVISPAVWGASYRYTAEDAREAIEECCGRTDAYLHRYLAFAHADPTTIVVPKLCLLYAVMTHTGMKKVHAVPCIGSCAGILISDKYWS
jgi:Ppx/GppA phosphatase family